MKNIDAILKEIGIELTDEQRATLNDEVKENYKPIADYNKQVDKIKSLEESEKATKEALAKFDGVDADGLKKQIEELTSTIEKNKSDYEAQIAARDFDDTIEKAINAAKGKNAKAIKALLDIDGLRDSKNQQQDIEKAIKALTEAEDSKMLFGEPEPKKIGEGNPIGTIKKEGGQAETTLASAIAEHYGK